MHAQKTSFNVVHAHKTSFKVVHAQKTSFKVVHDQKTSFKVVHVQKTSFKVVHAHKTSFNVVNSPLVEPVTLHVLFTFYGPMRTVRSVLETIQVIFKFAKVYSFQVNRGFVFLGKAIERSVWRVVSDLLEHCLHTSC